MATTLSPATTDFTATTRQSERQWQMIVRRFRRHRMAMVGLVVLVVIFTASLLAPVIAPFPRDAIVLGRTFMTPGSTDATGRLHILGTDHLGRDYFTRLLYAARVSLLVALTVQTIAATIGITLGLLAGFFGGWVDVAIMRTVEFVSTFPALTILLIVATLLLRNEDLITLPDFVTRSLSALMSVSPREAKQVALIIFTLALLGWTGEARLMRGQVLAVREQPYVESARALGSSNLRIVTRHVFPNAFPPLIVSYTLGLNGALVTESALSFLGFGIQDPTPTWGNMLAFANSFMFNHPWMPLVPGLPILLVSLAINYVGDGMRDALDPKMRV
ncbi:MAG TPA: ABC transporter permease [Herpetosiphonaceae bacterium]|nr:ABC transporter permease [Herpetosiphonaceae bacterium]